VFSILIGVALTGGITLPWVTGRLSQCAGIHTGLNLVILNAAAVWALQTLAGARRGVWTPFSWLKQSL